MRYAESLCLLVDLVRAPTEFYDHFVRFSAPLMFNLSYGEHLDDDGKDLAAV